MNWITTILINAGALYIGAMLLSGVKIRGFVQAIILVLAIAFLNVTVGSVLKIVSLGILSLGIFTWLLDAILIQIADYFFDDFEVKNFWWALALAAVVSLVHGGLVGFFG